MKKQPTKPKPNPLATKAQNILTKKLGSRKALEVGNPVVEHLVLTDQDAFLFSAVCYDGKRQQSASIVLLASGEEVERESLEEEEGRALFLGNAVLAPGAVLRIASTPISVSPATNDLTLGEGGSLAETVTVTVPPDAPIKADIYFLADTTGSMGDELAAVKAGAVSMLASLAGLGDIAFGVGDYKDFQDPQSDPYAFKNGLSPTTNQAAATAEINLWSASGGVDLPEGQFHALDELASAAANSTIWRPNARRIIVWFGDAPGHDPVCAGISGKAYNITEASLTAKLVAQSITVIAINVGSASAGLDDIANSGNYSGICGSSTTTAGQATRITAATGGSLQAGVNPANLVSVIQSLVTTAVSTINNVSLVATGAAAPFVISIQPPNYGPLGAGSHSLPFAVQLGGTVPCTGTAQVFDGFLDVVADGVVVAQKTLRITVPPCPVVAHPRIYAVKFVCGTQPNSRECASVRPGRYSTEINIHNPHDVKVRLRKRIVPVVLNGKPIGREPKYGEPLAKDAIILPPHCATMDDCCRIAELLDQNHTANPGLNIGFLEIIATDEVEVTAVYTATGLKNDAVSIDVERFDGRDYIKGH